MALDPKTLEIKGRWELGEKKSQNRAPEEVSRGLQAFPEEVSNRGLALCKESFLRVKRRKGPLSEAKGL